MNDVVKRKLNELKELATCIKAEANYLLEDINDVETDNDLPIVENKFSLIQRYAQEGYDKTLSTYDEFEEE
jgi:hypothetical protein